MFASKNSTCWARRPGTSHRGHRLPGNLSHRRDADRSCRTSRHDANAIQVRGLIRNFMRKNRDRLLCRSSGPIPMHLKTCLSVLVCVGLWPLMSAHSQPPAKPKRPGVTTPGVRIPITKLKPDAIYDVPGAPDWMAADKEMWVSNSPKGTVVTARSEEQRRDHLRGRQEPLFGAGRRFGSVWVPNCGDSTITRLDLKDGKTQATFPLTIADDEGGVAIGAGSFWILTDTRERSRASTRRPTRSSPRSTFTRIVRRGVRRERDLGHERGEEHADAAKRADPRHRGDHRRRTEARFLTVGEGGVWTLNQGDGSISRVDPKTNKVWRRSRPASRAAAARSRRVKDRYG